jgi:acyl-CoA reductase-like NAD-dependent aldehyde dehydrogenase
MYPGADLVIGGERRPGAGDMYPVTNPARPDEVVLEAPSASEEQVADAVAAATGAAPDWAAVPLPDRVAALRAAAGAAMDAWEAEDLATLYTAENGKVRSEAAMEFLAVPGFVEIYGGLAPDALAGRTIAAEDHTTVVEHRPYGVVGAILPFNAPVGLFASKALAALVAGNATVVKPPPTCPGALLAVIAVLAEHLPAGVLNAVNGPGIAVGEAVVTHPGVAMVSFTGGVAGGQAVLGAASRRMIPVVLELGGNDPAIVSPDLELTDELVDAILAAAFMNSGQICMAIKRLYAPRGRVDEVVDRLVARGSAMVTGDGLADGVTHGPLHTEKARRFATDLLKEAEDAGARVHRLGVLRDADAGGSLVQSAIATEAPADCRLVREEQFAPLLPVLAYDDVDDAVAQANDTRYGLTASIWSGDPGFVDAVAPRLEVGTVTVNAHSGAGVDSNAPFGGWKCSGIGRELGPEGLQAFTQTRSRVERPL